MHILRRPGSLLPALLSVFLIACSSGSPAVGPAAGTPALAAASNGASATAAPAGAAAGTAAPQGELTFAVSGFGLETFDPSRSPSLLDTPSLGGPIFQALYKLMPPDGQIAPFLLDTSTMAPDAMSWTLKLHDGITFSNGDPMTSADVKFSIERYASPESTTSSAATLRTTVDNIEIVDPLTVKVNLKKPTIDFPLVLTHPGNQAIVMPSKYIQQIGWDEFDKKPVGSGPYVLSDHKTGESVTYTPSPNAWRDKPVFQKITTLKVPEEQTRAAMLAQGSADMVELSPTTKQQVEDAGFKTLVVPDTTTFAIFFAGAYGSYPDNPLKNQLVRKALTLALDKQALLDGLNNGQGSVATIFAPVDPPHGAPQLPPTAYDPAAARAALTQAGYPNGLNLTFYATNILSCGTEYSSQMGQALGDYWGKIGVHTTVTSVDYSVFRPKIFANPVASDVVGSAYDWCTGGPPGQGPATLNSLFYSKGSVHGTDAIDAEAARALAASSADDAYSNTTQAYQKMYDQYSYIPLYYGPRIYGVSKKAENYPTTRGLADMLSWWTSNRPSFAASTR